MEGLYLNKFRIALPVAFPATRRPTRLPALPFLTAFCSETQCRISGRVIWRGDGQFENEPGPRRNNTFYVDGPTVDFHQLLGDG